MATPGEMAQDVGLVSRALTAARIYVSGHDQADAVRHGKDTVAYSALRTLLEQAERAAERLTTQVTPSLIGDEPCVPPLSLRDGGPL